MKESGLKGFMAKKLFGKKKKMVKKPVDNGSDD